MLQSKICTTRSSNLMFFVQQNSTTYTYNVDLQTVGSYVKGVAVDEVLLKRNLTSIANLFIA